MKPLLILGFLLALPCAAQQPKMPDVHSLVSPQNHWGALQSVVIPKTCRHIYQMRGRETCRVYLRFPPGLAGRLIFRTWDDSGDEDSLYRILLTNASVRGIFVQGVKGHRIFVEVTTR